MLLCRLVLSLALLGFYDCLKLLLGCFNPELISQGKQLLGVNAAEVVNGVLGDHVDLRNLLKFSLLLTQRLTLGRVSHPDVEGVVEAAETALEIQGLLNVCKVRLSWPNASKGADVELARVRYLK